MRTCKVGLDYFPFDIDFFDDEKVELISAKCGLKSETILIRLLCRIYRNGYYIDWDDDKSLLLLKKCGDSLSFDSLNTIINEALDRKFFDKSLYEKHGILTSCGIQKRFLEVTKRRKKVEMYQEYLRCDINDYNVTLIPLNASIGTQRKGKERKGKEIGDMNKCPHNTIVTLWNEKMVPHGLQKIRKWTEKRQNWLRARWKASPARQNIEWWEKLFDYILKVDFLMGRKEPTYGHERFCVTLEWIVRSEDNLVKILERRYEN